jgi:hypothetical protein
MQMAPQSLHWTAETVSLTQPLVAAKFFLLPQKEQGLGGDFLDFGSGFFGFFGNVDDSVVDLVSMAK